MRTTVAELAEAAEREHITKQPLIVAEIQWHKMARPVKAVRDPGFTTEFCMAESSHSGKIVSAVPEMAASGKIRSRRRGRGFLRWNDKRSV